MGLTSSLNTAIAGLSVTQLGIGIVSQNVANVDRAGYVRRQVGATETVSGNTISTAGTAVQRLLDVIVQRQLWQDTAGAAYTATRASSLSALDQLYGQPGSDSAVDSVFNRFTAALQSLQNDPSNYSLRIGVTDAATQLATRLNGLSQGVQALRSQAEASIGSAATQVNELLDSLTMVNARVAGGQPDSGTAELRDQRDRIVAEIAQYIDIKTSEDARGSLSIVTQSGTQIFDGRPAVKLVFDEHYGLSPNSQFTDNTAQRGVGTLRLVDGNGNSSDAITNKLFRSGEIAANIELRDTTLVQMQAQLDEIAAQMASALSDRNVNGVATAGGFSVDLAGLQRGNKLTLDYRATPAGAVQRVTLVNVAAGTTLPASITNDPSNRAIGIDFTGVPVSVQDQIDAALGPGFTATTAGSTLTLTAGGTPTVAGLSARITNTDFTTPGTAEFPFFLDGGSGGAPYTGSYEGGAQIVGLAGRIVVNPAVAADRDKLIAFQPGTPNGDNTRVKFMLESLTQNSHVIGKAGGLAGSGAAASMTVADLVQRTITSQGQAVEHAKRLDEGQQVALAAVQSRFQAATKANVDQEMATLIELQAAYAANARIISTVKEMMDVLLRV
jgi:flagellar hook-associated protein 1 FlgK